MEWGGRYHLIRQLARGGMGEVWEATTTGEGGFVRRVAIKRLLPEHGQDAAQARMFLDEARIASQLHHASVLSILDYGAVEGIPYQVLEYVDGVDAERLCRLGAEAGQPLPVELALHLCTEVAHALQYAHEASDPAGQPLGIVHRDVSPSNILVSWTGDVKLADFGIALARDRQERTLAGLTKGKPAYMSPEQLTRGKLDGRSDVFSLGCVLHALLTGHSPLAGEDRMADLLAGKELELDSTLPSDVRDIVARAVQRERHRRFQSGAEFAAASGKALAQRIDRDARSLLSHWIAQVRRGEEVGVRAAPRQAPPYIGMEVEQLLAGVVVPAPVPAKSPATGGTVKTLGAAQSLLEPQEVPQPRSSRRPWPWLALVLLGGLSALWAWSFARKEEPLAPPVSSVTAPSAPLLLEKSAGTSAAVASSPTQVEAPGMPASPQEQEVSSKRTARLRPSPPSTGATIRQSPARGSGALAVGGAGALRAELIVDGESRGHAPLLIELPLGEHILELVTPEGRRVGPERFQITEFHTPLAPLRWVVPGEQDSRQSPVAE